MKIPFIIIYPLFYLSFISYPLFYLSLSIYPLFYLSIIIYPLFYRSIIIYPLLYLSIIIYLWSILVHTGRKVLVCIIHFIHPLFYIRSMRVTLKNNIYFRLRFALVNAIKTFLFSTNLCLMFFCISEICKPNIKTGFWIQIAF